VVSIDDAAAMARALPGVTEGERHGNRTWSVAGKAFAWERQFSKADIRRFGGQQPPDGPILAVRTEDLGEKEALLAAHPGAYFTIPHFDGYSAILVHLSTATAAQVHEAVTDGWLACARPRWPGIFSASIRYRGQHIQRKADPDGIQRSARRQGPRLHPARAVRRAGPAL
jgi:hypothetical protein